MIKKIIWKIKNKIMNTKLTKKQLYAEIEELTLRIGKLIREEEMYKRILDEFGIEKEVEEIKESENFWGQMILSRMYKQGDKQVWTAMLIDEDIIHLYGVDKNGK